MAIPIQPKPSLAPSASEVAARCHEIQTSLGLADVPEFERLRLIGMAVRLALHVRGLPNLRYETLKLVAAHYLDIPSVALAPVMEILAEVEFVKLQTEGSTVKTVLPDVPYYESLYETLGEYGVDGGFNESEQLSIHLLCRLSKSPEKKDALESQLGAEPRLVRRMIDVGDQGDYLRVHRSRGRDIILAPAYFSENAEVFADVAAGPGSGQITRIVSSLRSSQGMPLSVIIARKEVAGNLMSTDDLRLLDRLAQDGAVKPPCITTRHAGNQYFLFTPTPSGAAMAPTQREIYERAMAVVAALRQGQFLPAKYAIRSPTAVLNALMTNLKLGKATTEATEQYRNLAILRVAQLVSVGAGFTEVRIIDTPENREALRIAHELLCAGVASGTEVDPDARAALLRDQTFVESIIASAELRRGRKVMLSQEQELEMESLYLR